MVLGRTFILCLVVLIFIFPPTLFNKFDSLKYISIVSITLIVYITIVVYYYQY